MARGVRPEQFGQFWRDARDREIPAEKLLGAVRSQGVGQAIAVEYKAGFVTNRQGCRRLMVQPGRLLDVAEPRHFRRRRPTTV